MENFVHKTFRSRITKLKRLPLWVYIMRELKISDLNKTQICKNLNSQWKNVSDDVELLIELDYVESFMVGNIKVLNLTNKGMDVMKVCDKNIFFSGDKE